MILDHVFGERDLQVVYRLVMCYELSDGRLVRDVP